MLPLDLTANGKWLVYLVSALIGVGFGVVLELAGFGNAKKLASQFYFRDMTVLKTMFSGILTACLLIFLAASLGYLDFSKIFVNQTYLWPGIVGGLVMGVGFVVGGYCPGTSAVSAASFKIDGLLFLVGTIVGAGIFAETVSLYEPFWNSSYTERLLVSDWLGWSIGATVVGVTALALILFYAAERAEAFMAGAPVRWAPQNPRYVAAAGSALALALFIWSKGEMTPEDKWARLGDQYQELLERREEQVHPLEYVKTWNDASVKLVTLDLRAPEAFETFHLAGSKNVQYDALLEPGLRFQLNQLPVNGVVILISDDPEVAARAWKRLKMEGVTNLYVLEHGLSDWREVFLPVADLPHFDWARPPLSVLDAFPKDSYQTRIKLKTARRAAGLCS
ncbi:MAG: rhodanese-like domain-containing protein [Deltaproteobacteria bacterium]|jgi:rhodanese-related sulfurtransferase|nr:rhodanese-like domain-containing protein [Deltaproteobacteria bacterium]